MATIAGAVIFYLWRELQKARKALMPATVDNPAGGTLTAPSGQVPKFKRQPSEEEIEETDEGEFEYFDNDDYSQMQHHHHFQQPRQFQQQPREFRELQQEIEPREEESTSEPLPGKIDRPSPAATDLNSRNDGEASDDAPAPDAELKDAPPPPKVIRRRSSTSRV